MDAMFTMTPPRVARIASIPQPVAYSVPIKSVWMASVQPASPSAADSADEALLTSTAMGPKVGGFFLGRTRRAMSSSVWEFIRLMTSGDRRIP